jgi:Xaa-Pro aminopeptidase
VETNERLAKFREVLTENRLDGFLVTNKKNIYYLSGFAGSSGYLLISAQGEAYLFTDFRYEEYAAALASRFVPRIQKGEPYAELKATVQSLAQGAGFRKLGVDAAHMTLKTHELLGKGLDGSAGILPGEDPCYKLRQIKDENELALMRASMKIADETLLRMKEYIRPGITEKEAAEELEATFKRLGAEGPSFETIAAAGKRSSMPHGQPTDNVIAEGDLVTLDFGCVVGGYASDQTRTFVMGSPDAKQERIYRLVLQAQEAAIAAAAPGRSTREIDRVARDIITGEGYGDNFGHGLGHSLGLDIHEDPRFSPITEDRILEPNMVLTVEPGIYLPGWGGIRIEDVVVITGGGCENITRSPKTLEFMTVMT